MKELKYNLGNLKYEDALIFDNRTIKQKYWDYLLESQIILSHFYADLILELRYIKIIVLLINLSLQFFLIASFILMNILVMFIIEMVLLVFFLIYLK